MLRLTHLVNPNEAHAEEAAAGVLTLRFEDRRRSRMHAWLEDGREAALFLPRGTILRDGDRLRDEAGTVVIVRAAPQTLSHVQSSDALLLARGAYHLGNRHVPVQLGRGWLAYEHDHVLDGMVRELGLTVDTRIAPFEPEAGGYRHAGAAGHGHEHAGAGDAHAHGDPHGHAHVHAHDHVDELVDTYGREGGGEKE